MWSWTIVCHDIFQTHGAGSTVGLLEWIPTTIVLILRGIVGLFPLAVIESSASQGCCWVPLAYAAAIWVLTDKWSICCWSALLSVVLYCTGLTYPMRCPKVPGWVPISIGGSIYVIGVDPTLDLGEYANIGITIHLVTIPSQCGSVLPKMGWSSFQLVGFCLGSMPLDWPKAYL